jgi:hypothetical protein
MQLKTGSNQLHLTYCLNIHPGETWPENLAAIQQFALAVRDRLNCEGPFGLGLRLSAEAAAELVKPATLAAFRDFLARHNLYVFTINGFSYGKFHGERIKDKVYAPDWGIPERLEYTFDLIDILSALLPPGVPGSISTVPGTYGEWCKSDIDLGKILLRLGQAAALCAQVRRQTGRHIRLALEPEPDCLWATADDMFELFFDTLPDFGARLLACDQQVSKATARKVLMAHLGVCVDTCHASVLFDDPLASLRGFCEEGVPVAKVQLSAAPSCIVMEESLKELEAFRDDVYLHQTAIRYDGIKCATYPDLPEALAAVPKLKDPWELRTHYHIPLSVEEFGHINSTRDELEDEFFELLWEGVCPHLEIETYTFSVLPPELRNRSVVDSIVSEYEWVLERMRSVE